MHIPREYSLITIIGLFLLAYLLDSIIEPMDLALLSPYQFFQDPFLSTFPFSTASVAIKGIAIFACPLWVMSFFSDKGFGKVSILFITSVLLQLYAYQNISTKSQAVPIEWSLSFTLAGLLLFFPIIYLLIKNILLSLHSNLTNARMNEAMIEAQKKYKDESREES